MNTLEQPSTMPKPPRRGPRTLHVVRTTRLTPHMLRVTLGGDELAGFPVDRSGAHIKLFLKRPDQELLTLPTMGSDGPIWPPKPLRPFVRTYTVRRYDAAAGELDIDFVLHGDNGPASSWALHAQPGDVIGISQPAERETRLLNTDWCLIMGDLSALPAIGAYLEVLPATTKGYALVEVPDSNEEQHLHNPSQVELIWLHQNGLQPNQSRLLIDAVRHLLWPTTGHVFVWLAGEASAVVSVRDFLRTEQGIDRESMYVIPYWKAGLDEEGYHQERHRVMDDEE